MGAIQCESGHLYDPEIHSACPYCKNERRKPVPCGEIPISDTSACPCCGSKRTVKILYGLPIPGVTEESLGVVFGGCAVYDGMPNRRCRDCGRDFRMRSELLGPP